MRFLCVMLVAGGCGWGAHQLHVPLGWLLGSLFGSTLLALRGITVSLEGIRPYVLIFLGLALGQTFNESVMRMLLGSLPAIVICALLTMLAGIAGARVFMRFAAMDARTAFFCGIPGGVVLMAIHARESGLSEQQVVLAQTIRLILVVLIYPALVALWAVPDIAGAALAGARGSAVVAWNDLLLWWLAGIGAAVVGRKMGIPNPWMLAPCVLSAAFTASGVVAQPVPEALIVLAQLVLGVSLGARMTPAFMRGAKKLVVASLICALLLSALLIALALAASGLTGLPPSASLLGMAPGGMPEMAITAQALSVSVPLVLGFHFIRVVFSNLLLEPIWRCARALRLI